MCMDERRRDKEREDDDDDADAAAAVVDVPVADISFPSSTAMAEASDNETSLLGIVASRSSEARSRLVAEEEQQQQSDLVQMKLASEKEDTSRAKEQFASASAASLAQDMKEAAAILLDNSADDHLLVSIARSRSNGQLVNDDGTPAVTGAAHTEEEGPKAKNKEKEQQQHWAREVAAAAAASSANKSQEESIMAVARLQREQPVTVGVTVTPGAYAANPGEELQRLETLPYQGLGAPEVESEAGLPNAGNSQASLSEAFEVEEDESFPHADPFEGEEPKRRKRHPFLLLLLVLVVASGCAIMGSLVYKNKQMNTPETVPSMAPSEIPLSAPTGSLDSTGSLDLLRMDLPKFTLDSLQTFGTPQWKAWDWLENHPELPGMEESRKRQLFALATFYYAMDGDDWYQPIKDRWMLQSDECYWYSTEFGYFYDDKGAREWTFVEWEVGFWNLPPCNQDDEFQSLMLNTLNLPLHHCLVPPEIVLLTSLSRLDLSWNYINASINDFLPSQFYQMTNLTDLLIIGNRYEDGGFFHGSIPSELGLMTNMKSLYLWGNHLSGPIPSELGLLTRMSYFIMADNRLTGQIPSQFGLLTLGDRIDIVSNNLAGTIPSEMGLLTNMWKLLLDNNSLTGTIPLELECLAKSGSLRSLSLANNSLSGTIPEGLCSLGFYDVGAEGFVEMGGRFQLGLSFDCNDQLCGCCWCPCPGSNYSADQCQTDPYRLFRDDEEWPGAFPAPANGTNSITINIRSDALPHQTTFDWSVWDEDSGLWNQTDSGGPQEKEMVHSYTMKVSSNALYRLQLHDTFGDGTCCWFGLGWFTITSSVPSHDNPNGTVIWDDTGVALEFTLVVFVWVDSNGHAYQVEHLPGIGYALIQDGSTPEAPVIVLADSEEGASVVNMISTTEKVGEEREP